MISPEVQSKIQIWRQKALENRLSEEEMVEAIKVMRQGRMAASVSPSAAKRTKAKADIPHADDLLQDMLDFE